MQNYLIIVLRKKNIKMANLFSYDQSHSSPKIWFQRNIINIKLQDMGKATAVVYTEVNKSLFAIFVVFF